MSNTQFTWGEWIAAPPPDPVWLIPGVLEVGAVGYIHGPPETFKSWLMLNLCLDLAAGMELWGGKFAAPAQPLRTLLVQAEGSHNGWHRRLYGLREEYPNKDMAFASLHTASNPVDKQPMQGEVERRLRDFRPDVVVFDPLANLFSGSDSNDSDVQRWLNLIADWRHRYDLTSLFVQHNRQSVRFEGKVVDAGEAEARGSSRLPGWGDFIGRIRRDRTTRIVSVHISKVREGLLESTDAARNFKLELGENGKLWPVESDRLDRNQAAVIAVLEEGPESGIKQVELIESIPGQAPSTARRTLNRLRDKGLVNISEGYRPVITLTTNPGNFEEE